MARADRPRAAALCAAVDRLIERFAASPWASAAAILVVAIIGFVPGVASIPPIDREESGFAEAAQRMVETGNYADIQPLPNLHRAVPIGMYWLEALAAGTVGGGADAPIWVYRLPALIGAIGAALLTWWMALAFGRPRAALIAGLFIAANITLAAEARLARADGLTVAVILVAEGTLARLWLGVNLKRATLYAALFWGALGVGILLKGWVAPMVLALTLVVLVYAQGGRDFLRRLQPLWGVPLALVIVLPWIVTLVSEHGLAAGNDRVVDALTRLGGELDPRAPPGSYALGFGGIFFPGASFFILGIPWFLNEWRRPAILFGLAAAVPFWIVTEFFAAKLPHMMLPAFPAIALLAATAVDEGMAKVTGKVSWFFSLGPLLVPLAMLIGTPIVLTIAGTDLPYGALFLLALSTAIGAVAWHWLRWGRAVAAVGATVVSAMVMFIGLFGMIVPNFDPIHVSARIVALGRDGTTCANPQYATAGYVEPGLLFLDDREVRFLDGDGAANFLNAGDCRFAFVEARYLASFRQRAEDLGIDLTDGGGVQGFDIGNGRWVRVRLFSVAPDAQ